MSERESLFSSLRERTHVARFSWTFTRTVLHHGRWQSLRQAIRNFKNLPAATDNKEREA